MRWRLAHYAKDAIPVGLKPSGPGTEEQRLQEKFEEIKAKVAAKTLEDRGVNY